MDEGSSPRGSKARCLACSIFRHELERLQTQGVLNLDISYLNSMLHMNPEKLDVLVHQAVATPRTADQGLVLLFGDCCPRMLDLQNEARVARPKALNCCEILLGSERYRQLRGEGAFFLMPEWAHQYRAVFKDHLGLEGTMVQSFMREMHTRIVYLDTGVMAVPHPLLKEIENFTGLPIEIMAIDMGELIKTLQGCLDRLDHNASF